MTDDDNLIDDIEKYLVRRPRPIRKTEVIANEIIGETEQDYVKEDGTKYHITQMWVRTVTKYTVARKVEE